MPEPATAPCSRLVADTSPGFEKTHAQLTLDKMSSSSQTLFNVFEYTRIYVYIYKVAQKNVYTLYSSISFE